MLGCDLGVSELFAPPWVTQGGWRGTGGNGVVLGLGEIPRAAFVIETTRLYFNWLFFPCPEQRIEFS